MKRLVKTLVVALLLVEGSFIAAASAQEDTMNEGTQVVYQKKTVIDFSDVTIKGELTKPEGAYMVNRKRTKFSQLIQIRSNFMPEMMNSTDNF
jgi:hypothetical protein